MMKVPCGVMSGKSPMNTVCYLISPVSLLMKRMSRKRSLIGDILLLALLDGVLGVAELVLAEGNLENMVLTLDGAGFLERLTKALVLKTLKGFPLNRDKVAGSSIASGIFPKLTRLRSVAVYA